MRPLDQKSSLDDIRRRFDADVERFSKLETGQQAAIDSPLMLELVSAVAACHVAPGGRVLDLGCGAGNFTLSVLGQDQAARLHVGGPEPADARSGGGAGFRREQRHGADDSIGHARAGTGRMDRST